ncbi:GatB/YqeY domain-containing protein [Xylona heveae TC161]|uniref:Altered inheritance of mitochondria protein 41 n=1 Tax=Xylona heveae (strain CBS 132557 / TC161) TaxID=1328760 RepID=A0A165ITT1_XYLHT|nr:GatB/YqeY domain-containing protein [Xylona heveae TC161]KZF25381.1 GatB/YqeY domain-containing protein [Xylona heveae TC161]
MLSRPLTACPTLRAVTSRPLRFMATPYLRTYATAPNTPQVPPLLAKFRTDLKDAMRAKDTTRLNVLRALLAEVTNAAKTSNPYKTDIQLLSLLRKRAAASKAAAQDFLEANRADLKEKEDAQIAILESYAGGIQTVGEEEIRAAVNQVIEKLKEEGARTDMGSVLKRLVGPGGELDGKPVEKAEVAKIVKGTLA